MTAELSRKRIAYIDWMRGLACVLMFQTHCYDSWLGGSARTTKFIGWSQLLGTLPAPLFLFLAGMSFALVTDRMRVKGASPNRDCDDDHPSWCGNFCARSVIPNSGICIRAAMVALD